MFFRRPALRLAWQAEIALPFAVVVLLFAFSFAQMSASNPPAAALRVTLIQPSIPQSLIWDETQNAARFRQLLALSERALDESEGAGRAAQVPVAADQTNSATRVTGPSDLLIWPESAVSEFDDATCAAITNFVRAHGVWLIFNADDAVPRPNATNEFDNDDFNAAFLFDPAGRFAGVYHKQKLVIFGEYIPFVRWLPLKKWFPSIPDGFAAGTEPAQFEINRWGETLREPQIEAGNGSSPALPSQSVTASPLICFEDTFPQLARKAVHEDTGLLVNLTNDGWFGESAEQWQHLANAVFRAVENGVPLVRCCNNGVTCWIDANGRVREYFRDGAGSVYGAGELTFDLPIPEHSPTLYHRYGDWFGWSCVGVAVLMAVGRARSR